MAPVTFYAVTAAPNVWSLPLPLPALLAAIVGAYVLLLVLALLLRYCWTERGGSPCDPDGCCSPSSSSSCTDCCLSCAQSCDCRVPTVAGCLDSCCPRPNLCESRLYRCCPCSQCVCGWHEPDCNNFSCLCCSLRLN
ncbi:uncharacterized protein LOC116937036 isoform X1 [Petromyzon marinus]|uniref:uncharacterized protein LOC116937036 isoform X1 n=2 Tax=Petromyzon marinus TaxID=7757 RepID=UPI003F6ED172